jgi:hypothetical protein
MGAGASLKASSRSKDPEAIDGRRPLEGSDPRRTRRGFVALAAAIGAAGGKNKAEGT